MPRHSTPPISLISLGCPKNLADLEAVVSLISNPKIVEESKAEIVLLNTCGFLKAARAEVFTTLKKLKNKKVVILGCLSNHFTPQVQKTYPQIYAVVSSANYKKIDQIIKGVAKNRRVTALSKEPIIFENPIGKSLLYQRSYAYVKIAEGCDNRCTYCLIPYLKGHFRSRKMPDILNEVKSLLKKGIKEIILVAQDCGYYGVDLYKKPSLAKLLKRIMAIGGANVPSGHFIVRVLYVYPERITDELLKTINSLKHVCKYLDIPLQHGDPEILKKMARQNNIQKTLALISKIRKRVPGIALRTSLIVGFPGETAKAFANLKTFLKKINFNHVGVFEYSRERGTPAYNFPNQLPERTKSQRRKELMLLQQQISLAKNASLIGKTLLCLFDHADYKKKHLIFRSQYLAPEIDGQIIVPFNKVKEKIHLDKFYDKFYKILIKKASPYDLEGELLRSPPRQTLPNH
ncbi:MAG: 30S ribosomal protein S12 methylthiotransferase RimO [Candidatus Gracilibacteria bacterium]